MKWTGYKKFGKSFEFETRDMHDHLEFNLRSFVGLRANQNVDGVFIGDHVSIGIILRTRKACIDLADGFEEAAKELREFSLKVK